MPASSRTVVAVVSIAAKLTPKCSSLTRHTDRAPGEQRLELSDPGRVLS
ncbi:MAG TPA: hypothetical protein VGM60_14085 [Pseudonocardia sp.]